MRSIVRFFMCGLCMGTADIIPGVSGGTMAFILGIYERLLRVIKSVNLLLLGDILAARFRAALKKLDLLFVLPLLLGIVAAFLFMTKIIHLPLLLKTHPEPVYSLFFGLIAMSIPLLLRGYRFMSGHRWFIGGLLAGLMVVNLVPTDTPDTWWFYLFSGALAISAMLLPGISGSFILLILGKYSAILEAIASLNTAILVPFVGGCLIGLAIFSRILSWALTRHHRAMLFFISGILAGSLYAIWPFQQRDYLMANGKEKLIASTPIWPESLSYETLLALSLAILGAATVWAIDKIAHRQAH